MAQHQPMEGYSHPGGDRPGGNRPGNDWHGGDRHGGERHGGVGYQALYPYVYAGYPWLFPGGFGSPLGDDTNQETDAAAQPGPQAPDLSNEPPAANPPEVAASDGPMFRPLYQPAPPEAPVHAQPATTLVFKDGRPSMEIHNYALTGATLYALDGETRREIPLSELNLPATIDANRKTGVDFALPSSY